MAGYYAVLAVLLLITGSEHDEIIWAGAFNKCDQGRLRRACAFVQSCQGHAAHLLKVFKWMKTKNSKAQII